MRLTPPSGRDEIEAFLLDELPALGPPPRGEAGLERARRFFARLDDPQDSARQVHIVGTAGKGTAAAAIIGRLVGAGATVGAHVSPHVYDLRERFLVDGGVPSWASVGDALAEMWPAMLDTSANEGRPPSFFEVTTALAWVLGRTAGADYLVTEAGIGGQFDATNGISRADKLTVVMPIGYDHLEILGAELVSIARNKADVIAPGGHVVVAPQPHPAALEIVLGVAAQRGATVELVAAQTAAPVPWQAEAQVIADRVVSHLADDDSRLDPAAPSTRAHLPGRLEELDFAGRTVVLDGAHNPLKLRALREGLAAHPVGLLVAALSHEKDLDACATELAQLADTVITTDFVVAAGDRVVRRSWSAHQLAEAIHLARPAATVVAVPGMDAAMAEASRSTDRQSRLLATGSFMMLEQVRAAVGRIANVEAVGGG